MKKIGLGLVAMLLALSGATASEGGLDKLPLLKDVAPQAVQISPHIPHMGEHWAAKENLPGGPIYCVIEGRVVCVEYMFDAKDLASGKEWVGLLPGIETPSITHIDVEFKPEGIEPRPVPLYQLHIYFADKALLSRH